MNNDIHHEIQHGPRPAGRSSLKSPFKKHLIKPVALALIFTFSYSQLVWAIDVRQMLLEAKASFEEDEVRRSAISPARLEETQAAQQAEIDQQQALQELMSFRLTTRNGDILKYVGQTLKEVERPDGTRLKNITLDGSGRITGADLSLADGSVQLLQDGKVIGYRLPNGTSVEYDATSGKVSKVLSPEGVLSTYTYADDGQGGEMTRVSTGAKHAVYGADGLLRTLTDSVTGHVVEFSQGRIGQVNIGATTYAYTPVALGDGRIRYDAEPTLSQVSGGADYPTSVTYAADGSVLETLLADESRLVFEGGLLKEAYDPQGDRTAFAFAQSSLYNITQSRITTDTLDVTYTGEGVIGSLTVDGLTIHYKDGGTVIHYLEKEDGTEIYDPVFDAQGNLSGGEIILPDGAVRYYEEGLLKIAREADRTKVYYEDLRPVTVITPEKLTYHLDHTLADRIEATLDPDIVPSVDTIVRLEYDTQMNLRKAVRQNQEIIHYL